MGLNNNVNAILAALISSGSIRYVRYPAGAAGIAMVSDGAAAAWAFAAYVQIVAAAVIANPCWLAGFSLHTGAVETHYGDLAIASGGAGAETDLAIVPYVAGIPTAVGVSVALPTWLTYPIKITGTPRLAGRIRKSTAASAAGGNLSVICITGVGT